MLGYVSLVHRPPNKIVMKYMKWSLSRTTIKLSKHIGACHVLLTWDLAADVPPNDSAKWRRETLTSQAELHRYFGTRRVPETRVIFMSKHATYFSFKVIISTMCM